jgi:hypothetical protein
MAEYRHVFRHEVQPDGPSSLGRRGSGTCTFCQSVDTVWQHDLNASSSTFRTLFGKGSIWGNSQRLCDRCEQLYNAGDYAALARLQTADPPSHQDELADNLIGLAAFCRADRGPRELQLANFAPGFEPWAEYTGADFVFGVWPEHRRTVFLGVELIASPWPSLDLAAVFRVVWSWVERDRSLDVTVMTARAAEALAWSEAQALEWLAQQG